MSPRSTEGPAAAGSVLVTGAVSSLGGFQPAPYLAVYAATKAFTLSLSQSLASELSGTGVRVLALCPGPVRTGFFTGLGSTELRGVDELSGDRGAP